MSHLAQRLNDRVLPQGGKGARELGLLAEGLAAAHRAGRVWRGELRVDAPNGLQVGANQRLALTREPRGEWKNV